jgi:hypothetical protein
VFAFCRAARPQDALPLPPRVSANINTRECSKSPRVIGAWARICARFFVRGAVPALAPRCTGAEACAEATAASSVNTKLQSLHARLYLQGLVFSRARRTHPDALRARPIVFASLDRILQNNRFCCFGEPLCHGRKIGQTIALSHFVWCASYDSVTHVRSVKSIAHTELGVKASALFHQLLRFKHSLLLHGRCACASSFLPLSFTFCIRRWTSSVAIVLIPCRLRSGDFFCSCTRVSETHVFPHLRTFFCMW